MSSPERTTWSKDLSATEAWEKIYGPTKLGRAGLIPVYDTDEGLWRIFRNTVTIWPGMENAVDPDKIDVLRGNVNSLMERYPDTIPQLEKLGVRVKSLLNRQIKTHADVVTWAESFFNVGPSSELPIHVQDAVSMAYDDIKIQVRTGRHPAFVLPVGSREAGVKQTVDYTVPGSKLRYGPRHEFTKTAFSLQTSGAAQSRIEATKRAQAQDVLNGAVRGRGRPRKDGLMPGSREAKAADRQKQRDQAKTRRQRAVKTPEPELATITELPPQRRVLVRVGNTSSVGS
jgi:hypothetical protein